MSRDMVLALGAVAWAIFAVVMFAHVVTGDLITPAIVVATGVIGVAVRLTRQVMPEGTETARR